MRIHHYKLDKLKDDICHELSQNVTNNVMKQIGEKYLKTMYLCYYAQIPDTG